MLDNVGHHSENSLVLKLAISDELGLSPVWYSSWDRYLTEKHDLVMVEHRDQFFLELFRMTFYEKSWF